MMGQTKMLLVLLTYLMVPLPNPLNHKRIGVVHVFVDVSLSVEHLSLKLAMIDR